MADTIKQTKTFCAGCALRGAFYAVQAAVGRKYNAVFCGDLSCYYLSGSCAVEPDYLCLENNTNITLSPGFDGLDPAKKNIVFVRDSTFTASCLTSIANTINDERDITIVVLSTDRPASFKNSDKPNADSFLSSDLPAIVLIRDAIAAIGVYALFEADPLFVEESIKAVTSALAHEGLSFVLLDAPCARKMKKADPVYLVANACAGCRRCATAIGCPALTWSKVGHMIAIDRSACSGCGLCTDICEFHALACSTRERVIPDLPKIDPEFWFPSREEINAALSQ